LLPSSVLATILNVDENGGNVGLSMALVSIRWVAICCRENEFDVVVGAEIWSFSLGTCCKNKAANKERECIMDNVDREGCNGWRVVVVMVGSPSW
jgi:hypothetical protein